MNMNTEAKDNVHQVGSQAKDCKHSMLESGEEKETTVRKPARRAHSLDAEETHAARVEKKPTRRNL